MDITNLINLSIVEAKNLMRKGEISPTELVKAHLERAEETKELNAYVLMMEEFALKQAIESERKYKQGNHGIIEGIPVAIKDSFCIKGFRTTACSRILENFIPEYDSTVTSYLCKHGGIMIGKTNMDELAMGSSNKTSCFGSVINPWRRNGDDSKLVPGGSSGGSAAAVAARSCMGALGSDTGGSVRQPASFTGVAGIKPTYGRCSRYGLVAYASSLDQAGVFARSVEDSSLMLQAVCGYDKYDATSKNIDVPEWSKSLKNGIKGLKIGIPKEYYIDGINAQIIALWREGMEWLKEAGAEIVDISLPHTQYALPIYYIIAPAEASSNLSRFDGIRYGLRVEEEGDDINAMISKTRGQGFGEEVKRRIMIGTYLLSSAQYDLHYLKAQKVRRLLQKDFIDAFEKIDAILIPTAPSEAFAIDEQITDPLTMYLNDIFTVTVNLAGLPGISVPGGLSENGLPLGLQVISKPYDEETMLKVAYQIEAAANFKGL
ncbi:MAG: Asp-tRNA(Asn)/Glu-tRNA(Gln) amidotransferase subunit GatA [Candidatus Midichloria mitochondrii]|uniref:Glutamyl-tRNA(Gln) amidotransferase subunit A n=1 Tax=Midichloria mitochondrii (strain IricVA) TaxID=696127 RepID=F7XWS5_MIDMI|nr:glutamyl-tRNA amidotransferase A subunit [Candidatus Midichloria mitochondrii IricVA]